MSTYPHTPAPAHPRTQLSILVAVALLAAFFRLYHLDSIPPGLFGDEAANGLVAASIQNGEAFPVYVEEPEETKWGSREPLYHYWMAAVFSVFGADTPAIRLTSALAGIATVALFFLLCRRIFDRRIATFAAILLAAGKWHVIASRIGLRAILVPLWIVLVVLLLDSLRRHRAFSGAVVFGIVIGLGFYTYPSFWMIPPCLLIVWISSTAPAETNSGGQRSTPALLLAAGIAALVVLSPLIRYAVEKPDYYFARVNRAAAVTADSGNRGPALRENVQRVLFMLHFRGDRNPRHNIPDEPLLDPLTGILFLVGLYLVAKRDGLDPPRQVGLVAFWLLPLVPSALADSAPHALRALGAAPAVYLIAALGWARLSRIKMIGPILALALGVAIVGINYRDYFRRWAPNPAVVAGFNTDAVRFFEYIAEAAETQDVYTSQYVYTSPQLRFLALRSPNTWAPIADASTFLAHQGENRDRLFVSDEPAVNALIEQLYDGNAEVISRYSVPGGRTGRIYRVPSRSLKASLDPMDAALIRAVSSRPSGIKNFTAEAPRR
jgi:4-amino-4-deoxy-L-arabinose transferase-like glycosyltransferase